MSDENKDTGGGGELSRLFLSVPGLTILISVAAMFFARSPYELARPHQDPKTGEAVGDKLIADSRSWQDPFSGITLIGDGKDTDQNVTNLVKRSIASLKSLSRTVSDVSKAKKVGIFIKLVNGSPYANGVETRVRDRVAIQSAMRAGGFVKKDTEHIDYFVLPSIVDATNCINWVVTTKRAISNNEELPALVGKSGVIVPYEWFETDSTVPPEKSDFGKILLIWLKESDIQPSPFQKLTGVLASILDGADEHATTNTSLAILGPRSSGCLQSMVADQSLRDSPPSSYPNFSNAWNIVRNSRIASTSASAPDVFFDHDGPDSGDEWPRDRVGRVIKQNLPGCDFKAFGNTDDQLCFLLLGELSLRDVDVTKDTIVLLSEYDTFYGRALPLAFKAAVMVMQSNTNKWIEHKNPEKLWKALLQSEAPFRRASSGSYAELLHEFEIKVHELQNNVDAGPKNIAYYSFLAGVDGTKSAQSGGAKDKNDPHGAIENERIEIAEGDHQLDYMRRLGDGIGGNIPIVLSTTNRVKAVGFLGSDFYDKLLLLQSIREQAPFAEYFTTDLDCRLNLPSQYQWTRNLITVSSYNLQPPQKIEASIHLAPFRDGYQTALYLGCRWCINTNGYYPQSAIASYEIGRKHPHWLAPPRGAGGTDRPFAGAEESNWKEELKAVPHYLISAPALLTGVAGFFLIGIITLVPFAESIIIKRKGWALYLRILMLIGSVIVVPLFGCLLFSPLWLIFRDSIEPIEIADGISVLSSACLLCLAIGTVIFAVIAISCDETWSPDGTSALWCTFIFPIMGFLIAWTMWNEPVPYRGSNGLFKTLLLVAWSVNGFLIVFFFLWWEALFRSAVELSEAIRKGPAKFNVAAAAEWLERAQELQQESKKAGKRLAFPMIGILLVTLAASPWLDGWQWTAWMKVLVAFEVFVLVLYPIAVHRTAHGIKVGLLNKIQSKRLAEIQSSGATVPSDPVEPMVEELNQGCFGPLAKQPVFGALAWLAGGTGIVSILQPILTGHP